MQLTRESYKRIFFFTAGVIFILAVVPSDGVELSFGERGFKIGKGGTKGNF